MYKVWYLVVAGPVQASAGAPSTTHRRLNPRNRPGPQPTWSGLCVSPYDSCLAFLPRVEKASVEPFPPTPSHTTRGRRGTDKLLTASHRAKMARQVTLRLRSREPEPATVSQSGSDPQ
eukprot:TRINITY_DN63935_c0_g1_i1.p2 TRINITY_DN63935_c0_g1~~TRINITY_DN63935_c0_g1_i1.p2  ORF type:complete len:118 (-),score=1.10 TRINITY_DN63935_c0_g1_i1:41-394(-)